MEHLLLKAAVTAATDKGEFTAVISTATIDREKDIVDPQGFVRALRKWVPLGKKVPLAWNHSTKAEDQIGYIDPSTIKVRGNEVVASGWIDQTTQVGKEAWRLVKMGILGFSFGYLVPDGGSTPRKGGGRHITALDVFEVTATPAPMNGDTRVLDYKAIKGHATVGAHARDKLHNLIAYYMKKPHPFTACVRDNTKRFGPDGADKVCATLKDIGMGTTHWRGRGKALPEPADAVGNDEPTQDDLDSMATELHDAAGGNLDGLLEMWAEWMLANGDDPTANNGPNPADKSLTPEQLRREADRIEFEHATNSTARRKAVNDSDNDGDNDSDEDDPNELLGLMISHAQDFINDEDDPNDVAVMRQIMVLLLRLQTAEAAEDPGKSLKAVWSTSFVNDLPDSAFLYIVPGGSKDDQGKTTPRSLRYFPYKDDSGKVDQPHLRNALSRIPQSNLPSDVKDRLAKQAQRILDQQKAVDETGQEHKARPVDPLRRLADAVALDFASDGESRRKPPRRQDAPTRQPELSLKELRQRMREEMLTALTGETTS